MPKLTPADLTICIHRTAEAHRLGKGTICGMRGKREPVFLCGLHGRECTPRRFTNNGPIVCATCDDRNDGGLLPGPGKGAFVDSDHPIKDRNVCG